MIRFILSDLLRNNSTLAHNNPPNQTNCFVKFQNLLWRISFLLSMNTWKCYKTTLLLLFFFLLSCSYSDTKNIFIFCYGSARSLSIFLPSWHKVSQPCFLPPWHKGTAYFSTHSHLPSRNPKGCKRSSQSPPSYNPLENNPEFSLPKS